MLVGWRWGRRSRDRKRSRSGFKGTEILSLALNKLSASQAALLKAREEIRAKKLSFYLLLFLFLFTFKGKVDSLCATYGTLSKLLPCGVRKPIVGLSRTRPQLGHLAGRILHQFLPKKPWPAASPSPFQALSHTCGVLLLVEVMKPTLTPYH